MKFIKNNGDEVIIDGEIDLVQKAINSGLFSVKVGCSEFSNIGLDKEGETANFWGYDDDFFGEGISKLCFQLDILREATEKDNPKEFLKEEELYNRVIKLAGEFNLNFAIEKLKNNINSFLDNPAILKQALKDFDHLQDYADDILDNCNIDYKYKKAK